MFDPAQIAGGAVYAILLYLGLLYALQLIPAMSGMALGTRGNVALVGSLVLTGIPFGIIAWMRDRLAHQVASVTPSRSCASMTRCAGWFRRTSCRPTPAR